MTEGANKKNPLVAVLIVGVVVVAALLGVIVFLLLGRGNDAPAPVVVNNAPEQRAIVVNEDNAEEIVDSIINEPTTPIGYYEVNMNFTWNFPDGQSPSSNAYVENNVTNSSAVYFDVFLQEDESVTLYESPILPRGMHVNEITLAQDLDAGTYPCVIVYHLIDDQQRTTSTLRLTMEIVVEN